jgi:hypothetical protein
MHGALPLSVAPSGRRTNCLFVVLSQSLLLGQVRRRERLSRRHVTCQISADRLPKTGDVIRAGCPSDQNV